MRALIHHEFRILRRDPLPFIISFLFPLLMMAFLKPALHAVMLASGRSQLNGAQQVVPGMTLMFALFLVSNVGFAFFREHDWHTWDRLRSTSASTAELLVGKIFPNFVLLTALMTGLIFVGGVTYGMEMPGSKVGLLALLISLAAWMTSTGVALAFVLRTMAQSTAVANFLSLALSGLGGVLTPISTLPRWAQTIAPATPTYWAMHGFHTLAHGPARLTDIAASLTVLWVFAAAAIAVATWRFRVESRHSM
jgi:ABC-2 type transport system permease protein